jgi:peptidoglycan glycosyltransferase
VNRQITRLAVSAIALIAALIVGTTYWQTWAVAGLNDRQDNAIQRVVQFTIDRGRIYAAGGKIVLAENVKRKVGGQTLYFRRYPNGFFAPHVIGYSTVGRSRAGLEQSENDYLTGANGDLTSVATTAIDKLKGVTVHGNDLILTLNPRAQSTAVNALRGKCGAAVALDPRTGAVLALASYPTFNPNEIEKRYAKVANRRVSACPKYSAPLLDRATQGLYPPGSSFKVVTAAAALDSGKVKPDTEFDDPGYCIEYGKRVSNAGSNPEAPETFGRVTFAFGLQHSINSVFCNVGKQIGAGLILDYARKFGLYQVPGLELPLDAQSASGLYDQRRHKLFEPKDPATQVDPGRLAFGQERMLVTPIQMAMVAGAVANDGVLLRPYLVDEIRTRKGKVVTRTKPHKIRRVVSSEVAQELTQMMESVVTGGTGTAAAISGVRVAGKTGTAEIGIAHHYDAWFIAFAPADAPRVAVAVQLENQTGFGGEVAAPIAKQIMEAILRRPSNT